MEIQELRFKDLVFNEAVSARVGIPDPEKISHLAENFIERRGAGMNHQIQPGVVRATGKGKFEVIVGRNRAYANKAATDAAKEDYLFNAVVVESGDEAALIDAIQENEYRVASNIFDRATAVERLIALGKSQVEIATIFGLSEASISQTRKAGKLDTKYKRAVENGDLEPDAAILIANLDADETTKTEIFEEAQRHKERYLRIEASIGNKQARADADAKIKEAKEKADKIKEDAKAKEAARKILEKEAKELADSLSKTKDVDEKVKVDKARESKIAEARELAKQGLVLLKDQDKALKALEKAKKDKETLKEKQAAKRPTSQEEIKTAAKGKGLDTGKLPRLNAQKIEAELELLAEDKDNPVPTAVGELIGVLEQFINQDKTALQLRNAFVLFCKTDDQLTKARAERSAAAKQPATKAAKGGK